MGFRNKYWEGGGELGYVVWGGKNGIIEGNSFVGGIIGGRDVGYRISKGMIGNKVLGDGSSVERLGGLIDMSEFSGLVGEGKEVSNVRFSGVIVEGVKCN